MRRQTIQYPYRKFADGRSRPIIPVKFLHKDNYLTINTLVDSGSDICIVWAGYCQLLGIKFTDGKLYPFAGIGSTGPQVGFMHKVGLVLGEVTINADVVFSQEVGPRLALVGHRSFFEKFIVTFNYQKKMITLSPQNTPIR